MDSVQTQATIAALLTETRRFPPPPEFAARANLRDPGVYEEAERDFEAFWARHAETELEWFRKWDRVLEWNPPWAKWFVGGQTNVCYNCVDRHTRTWRRTKAALVWEGEPGTAGSSRTWTCTGRSSGSATPCGVSGYSRATG